MINYYLWSIMVLLVLVLVQFYFSFKLYLITEKQRIEITKLVREIAYLKKVKK